MDSPRLHVMCHDSALGRWESVIRPPAPRIAAHVRDYQGYRESGPVSVRRREVANDYAVLIISFGPPIALFDSAEPPDRSRVHTSFVAGLYDRWVATEHAGAQHGVQVNLTALGARMLLGMPMDQLAGQAIALEDVLGREGPRLAERLAEAPTWAARFDLLDDVLAERLGRASTPSPAAAWAWRRLTETGGRLSIGALADELGCSRKYLISAFRSHVGLPPKTYARILRFQRAVRLLERDDGRLFARIAADCGYYDQAHLNRDFREFAGTTPGEHVARLLPSGFGVSDQ